MLCLACGYPSCMRVLASKLAEPFFFFFFRFVCGGCGGGGG